MSVWKNPLYAAQQAIVRQMKAERRYEEDKELFRNQATHICKCYFYKLSRALAARTMADWWLIHEVQEPVVGDAAYNERSAELSQAVRDRVDLVYAAIDACKLSEAEELEYRARTVCL